MERARNLSALVMMCDWMWSMKSELVKHLIHYLSSLFQNLSNKSNIVAPSQPKLSSASIAATTKYEKRRNLREGNIDRWKERQQKQSGASIILRSIFSSLSPLFFPNHDFILPASIFLLYSDYLYSLFNCCRTKFLLIKKQSIMYHVFKPLSFIFSNIFPNQSSMTTINRDVRWRKSAPAITITKM